MRKELLGCSTSPIIHYAFRGLAMSLRRIGCASADVATGRGVFSLPHPQLYVRLRLLVTLRSVFPRRKGTKKFTQVVPPLAVGSHRLRFPAGQRFSMGRAVRSPSPDI